MRQRIALVGAVEILDSRGDPTLRVRVGLDEGTVADAFVPSDALTGENAVLELWDSNAVRYGGKGVERAAGNVTGSITPVLLGATGPARPHRPRAPRPRRHAGQVAARRQRLPRRTHGGGVVRGAAALRPFPPTRRAAHLSDGKRKT